MVVELSIGKHARLVHLPTCSRDSIRGGCASWYCRIYNSPRSRTCSGISAYCMCSARRASSTVGEAARTQVQFRADRLRAWSTGHVNASGGQWRVIRRQSRPRFLATVLRCTRGEQPGLYDAPRRRWRSRFLSLEEKDHALVARYSSRSGKGGGGKNFWKVSGVNFPEVAASPPEVRVRTVCRDHGPRKFLQSGMPRASAIRRAVEEPRVRDLMVWTKRNIAVGSGKTE